MSQRGSVVRGRCAHVREYVPAARFLVGADRDFKLERRIVLRDRRRSRKTFERRLLHRELRRFTSRECVQLPIRDAFATKREECAEVRREDHRVHLVRVRRGLRRVYRLAQHPQRDDDVTGDVRGELGLEHAAADGRHGGSEHSARRSVERNGERLGVGERLEKGSVAIPRVNVKRHRLADGDVSAQRSPRGEHRGSGVDLRERSLRG